MDATLDLRRTKSCTVMALWLVREVDAKGKPFALHLARCNQWLDSGLVESGFQGARYCVETLRDTGDMREAVNAHYQRYGGRSNWSGWQRGGRGGGGWDRDDTPVVATEWIPPTNWFPDQPQPAAYQLRSSLSLLRSHSRSTSLTRTLMTLGCQMPGASDV